MTGRFTQRGRFFKKGSQLEKTKMDTTNVRIAYGAGRWFDKDPDTLTKQVDGFLEKASADLKPVDHPVFGCILPHAGFQYSGQTAAYSIAGLKRDAETYGAPDVIFVVGFSHFKHHSNVAILDGSGMQTPCGFVAFDHDAMKTFVGSRDSLVFDAAPHRGEHSAENQIPFIQRAFPGVKVVIMVIGEGRGSFFADIAEGLMDVSKTKKLYVVGSTDMMHDPSFELVRDTDAVTLKLTEAMDIQGLIKAYEQKQIYCGMTAVLTVMLYCHGRGATKGICLAHTNSELVTGQRNSGWVVGYCAFVF